ncbi:MAG: hypothetical protein NFCOHLIN_02743 [Gammaproteobacteria bacterium]|nr:hypothetical protein [Gammaproteobacteria bacterium]
MGMTWQSAAGLLAAAILVPGAGVAKQIGEPTEISARYRTGDTYMGIRLLGTVRLAKDPVDDHSASGLSGLAWDEDEGLLYAVSDRGYLLHMQPRFDEGRIVGVELTAAHGLRGRKQDRLPHYLGDAEGLAIVNGSNGVTGDAELLISFEGTPRVERYRPNGQWIAGVPLPGVLGDGSRYACRNCQLEGIALDPVLGLLLAPQRPLRGQPRDLHSVFDARSRAWSFPAVAESHCSLVDLASTPQGGLLVLERRYRNVFSPIVIAIRRLRVDPARQPNGGATVVDDLAILDNTRGWSLDNFEGLAHHRDNRYFMVSDDNNSALQSTLLLYFELDAHR